MKPAYFLILLLVVFRAAVWAEGPDVTFQKALDAYDAKEFATAVELFEGILKGGDVAPEVYFNLGHAYFQSGQAGQAALNYRRAQRLMPNNPQIRSNLRKASEAGRRPLPRSHVVIEFIRTLPHAVYMWVVFCAFWLTLILFCIFCFTRPGAATWLRFGLVGLIILAAASYGGHLTDPQNYPDEVVVTGKKVEAKFSPNQDADTEFSMGPGAIALVIRKQDGLLEVESGSQRGWIPENAVERVTLPSPPGTSLADMIDSLLTKLQ